MAFCRQCGAQMPDDAAFCQACGTPVATQQGTQQQYTDSQQGYQQPNGAPQQQYTAPQQQVYVTPEMDIQQNRGIAWLAYMGILFLIPLFARKESPYCQYHVKQGATLFATELAYLITTKILLAFIGLIFPGYSLYGFVVHSTIYNVFNVIFSLGYIFFFVLAIMGIVNAAKGRIQELPLIGKIPFVATLLDKIYANINK